jgi:hypothetical protein
MNFHQVRLEGHLAIIGSMFLISPFEHRRFVLPLNKVSWNDAIFILSFLAGKYCRRKSKEFLLEYLHHGMQHSGRLPLWLLWCILLTTSWEIVLSSVSVNLALKLKCFYVSFLCVTENILILPLQYICFLVKVSVRMSDHIPVSKLDYTFH